MPVPADVAILLVCVFLTSAFGTGLMRRYALSRRVLDVPNGRSSHVRAVPLGGGVPLALTAIAGVLAAWSLGRMDGRLALALAIGGFVLTVIGWADDRRTVPAPVRAGAQAVLALAAVLLLGGMPDVGTGNATLHLGVLGIPLAALGIVWMANLYNFMDGIDGLAGGQGAAAGLLGGAVVWVGGSPSVGTAALILGAATGGFLLWNWQPARIFMGDAGSVTLGFGFAVIAVAAQNAGAAPLLAWVLIFGGFLFDGTATLLRRMVRGEDWTAPHRLHAYQRLVQSGLSHATVSGVALVLTCALSLAALELVQGRLDGVPLIIAAIVVLGALYLIAERRRPMGPGPRRDAARPRTQPRTAE